MVVLQPRPNGCETEHASNVKMSRTRRTRCIFSCLTRSPPTTRATPQLSRSADSGAHLMRLSVRTSPFYAAVLTHAVLGAPLDRLAHFRHGMVRGGL